MSVITAAIYKRVRLNSDAIKRRQKIAINMQNGM